MTLSGIVLDNNYYDNDPTPADAPGNSPVHSPGDRVGVHSTTPAGGYFHKYIESELEWLRSYLLSDTYSAGFLVFLHDPPPSNVTNIRAVLDCFQQDGRPAIFFCGHEHGGGRVLTYSTTDGQKTYTFYKAPTSENTFCWTRGTVHYSSGSIVVDSFDIKNWTDYGGWTNQLPFAVVP